MDRNKNGLLEREEVKIALYSYHICSEDREIDAVMEVFDVNRDGVLSYNEFLRAIVGEMNQRRREICTQAFNVLDESLDGVIELSEIKRIYNAKRHPDVLDGKRTEDEVLCDFLDTFEFHYALRYGDKCKDRRITLDEWLEYYNNVSANIDNDAHFELLIRNAYHL